jgi:hypothetical protein
MRRGLATRGDRHSSIPLNDCLAIGATQINYQLLFQYQVQRSLTNDVIEGTDEINDHDSRAG